MQNEKARTPARQALIVLGMHRSGTSAMSGVLAKLGARPPATLMRPAPDNPKGYWESTALMRFHDEVLASAGTTWSDWGRFNPEWMESPVAEDFIARLPGILEQEYGDAKLLLIKDPRICRLLPLWLRVLPELDISPRIVLPMRHPLEVACSLAARNEFGRQRSYLAWLRHMLDAEYHSRSCKRVVISYANMLVDWRRQVERISAELGIKWPKWSSSVEVDIDAFLNTELRHHAADDAIPVDSFGIAGWVAQAHKAFEKLATPGPVRDATLYALDQVREEFDHSSGIYAAVVRECEAKAQAKVRELNERITETGEQYARLVKGLVEIAATIRAGKMDTLQDSSFAAGELVALTEQLRAAHASWTQLSATDAAHIADLSSRLAASQANLSQAASKIETQIDEIGQLELDIAKERAMRAGDKLDGESRLIGLENELELHRHLAADRLDQVRHMQEGRLWKAAMRLRRFVARSQATPVAGAAIVPDSEAVRQSGLFDQAWYLRQYPDVREKGMDPVKHYLRYGASEGRDPGPGFSTRDYLRRYPDVAASGSNPLLHYVRYGINEGRRAREHGQEKMI